MQVSINRWLLSRFAKPFAFVLALLPILWLVLAAAMDWLGANPAEALERSTGDWTLRMLCVVLAITPVRTVLQLPGLARFRRMAGLFVYFYAVLHLLTYAWFDMGFELVDIAKDIVKRPFILVGFSAVVLLTPLALTSFNRAIRALGGKRWQVLHRLVYAVAVLAIVHFFWMRAGKNNFAEVAVYASILGVLLGWRVLKLVRKIRLQPPSMLRKQLSKT
ncbi:sulfite oxidase heme-binding subunit YedZ [Candidatus Aalborgicola defluviihabitans]|uniref:sulfite oxidase heme-binding subunit YedZ n=1 Tax=Candidatus Aalborgicola defluviihabitans TaxID=3386187 RepID=UPI001ECA3EB0|nr:sulfoxide reductase heme-binding subunit YedZ [Burkholderiales bacterium]